MLSLLGSLLGFGTSFLPKVMDYFAEKRDQAHELAMMEKQIEAQERVAQVKLQMTEVDAAVREVESAHQEQAEAVRRGAKWLANLSGSIRPVVTYAFVIEFLAVTWSMAYLLFDQGGFTLETISAINTEVLDDDYMGMLSAMLSFWYGNRSFGGRKT